MGGIIDYLKNFSLIPLRHFNFGPEGLFISLFLIFFLLWGLSLGRTRALISLLGIYVAYMIEMTFPFWDQLQSFIKFPQDNYLIKAGFFIVVYAIVFIILNNSVLKRRLSAKDSSFLAVAIISVLQLGLLISIILNNIPISKIPKLPDYFYRYFSTSEALFYWAVLPVVAILFLRRKNEK